MSKIRIKNFGPIKEGFKETLADGSINEWMDVKKVTVLNGNQGSGKSTVAKVISTLTWVEKALNRGDFDTFHLTNYDFIDLFVYHRINKYFKDDTIIEYVGERASIIFDNKKTYLNIEMIECSNFAPPQIMYIPDSRNFLSVIKDATGVKGLPASLFDFAEELKRGQKNTKGGEISLPVNNVKYQYDYRSDTSYLIGEDFLINMLDASSGFQSLVPLYLVSSNLANAILKDSEISPENISVNQSIRMRNEISAIMLDSKILDEEKLKRVVKVKSKFQNKTFINIVEEPEQNLFPTSQKNVLNSLLEFNNMKEGNKLIMTTHSPYLINYLTLAVKANELKEKVSSEDLKKRLNDIVPIVSTVNPKDLVIYELDERDGSIKKLGNYEGIPSDHNFLNQSLADGNRLFDSLLEIEEEL